MTAPRLSKRTGVSAPREAIPAAGVRVETTLRPVTSRVQWRESPKGAASADHVGEESGEVRDEIRW